MKPSKRKKTRTIREDCLTYLYDEVLMYCENDDFVFRGYNLNKNPFLKKLEDGEHFTFKCKMKEARIGQTDVFYFSRSGGKIKSFFIHLRNALAHNRIKMKADGIGITVEDEYNGQLTMYAEISSFVKLKTIITEIKKNYKT